MRSSGALSAYSGMAVAKFVGFLVTHPPRSPPIIFLEPDLDLTRRQEATPEPT